MIILKAIISFSLFGLLVAPTATASKNLVCFYDSSSYLREGKSRLEPHQLEMALDFCSHLIYGYAGLNPKTFELVSLNVDLDMFHYAQITRLKSRFPQLKVYLSVGGDKDVDEVHPLKYVQLLEATRQQQQRFIDSAITLLRNNGFDGLDLAFQLPRNKPRKVHSFMGNYWKQFKKFFTGDYVVDEQADAHKRQYTELTRNLKTAFKYSNLSLSMTVLPNVNSTWYFHPASLEPNFEFVNLAAFDFLTPERNPEEADFTAPIYPPPEQNRLPHYNIKFQINYWLDNKLPAGKLNLGIASYGRAWKMTTDSGITGVPIVANTAGPAEPGPMTHTAGLLSWPEICSMSSYNGNTSSSDKYASLRRVSDPEQRYDNYALRPAVPNGDHGLWVCYDDPDMAANKARYARARGLGGVALFDLSYDDFQGLCIGQKYPILRSVKLELEFELISP